MNKLLIGALLMATTTFAQTTTPTSKSGTAKASSSASKSGTTKASSSSMASGGKTAKATSTSGTSSSATSSTGSTAGASQTRKVTKAMAAKPIPETPVSANLKSGDNAIPSYKIAKDHGEHKTKYGYSPRRNAAGARLDTMSKKKP